MKKSEDASLERLCENLCTGLFGWNKNLRRRCRAKTPCREVRKIQAESKQKGKPDIFIIAPSGKRVNLSALMRALRRAYYA